MTRVCGGMLWMMLLLAATDFYGPMGTGVATPGIGYTSGSVWTEIEPDSVSQGLGNMVCGTQ